LRAGFDEPVGPHRFRHGCATALLESGADLRSIQMLLGHSSIQTTQIYTNVTTQNLVKTVDEHHPLSRPGVVSDSEI
jgi:integrase/recombinase XerD